MVRRHPGEGGCPIFCGALHALHTVTSPYARRIFGDLPGLPAGMMHHGLPLENFGGVTLIPTSPLPKPWRMRCCKGMNSALGQPAMGMGGTTWFWGVGAL